MTPIQPIPIHELANIVPRASTSEQKELDHDIATHGFDTSMGTISIYKGAILDGRNRQEALLKAGLDPRDYSTDLGDISYQEASNKAYRFNSRRNLTTTQKVIYAWNQTQLPKDKGRLTQALSSEKFQVSVSMLKHVGTINKYALLLNSSLYSTNIYKVEKVATSSYSRIIATTNILNNLFNGSFIKVGNEGKATNSIKMIAQNLKVLHEEASVTTASALAEWDADAYIKTEAGKNYYRTLITTNNLPETAVGIRMALAELANFKFTIAKDYTKPLDDYEQPIIHGELA